MSNDEKSPKAEKDVLRVALDKDAMDAFYKMVAELKSQNAFVKLQPSAFVSFVVADYYRAHFKDDMVVLTSQFFDSQGYYESQLRAAKAVANFEEVMSETLAFIKQIKAKATRKPAGNKRVKAHDKDHVE